MKKIFAAIALGLALMAFSPVPTQARPDWSMGTAHFKGNMPSHSMSVGVVKFYYNGTLKKVGSMGTTDIYECTGECCVIFPKGYNGRKIEVRSPKTVQYQYLK